jgi:hypothetical protein
MIFDFISVRFLTHDYFLFLDQARYFYNLLRKTQAPQWMMVIVRKLTQAEFVPRSAGARRLCKKMLFEILRQRLSQISQMQQTGSIATTAILREQGFAAPSNELALVGNSLYGPTQLYERQLLTEVACLWPFES